MKDNYIDTHFIGEFKVGDNVKFNAQIISDLYAASELLDYDFFEEDRLIKPKVIFNFSLIDAVLYDFHNRVYSHTSEFNYLDEHIVMEIRAMDSQHVRAMTTSKRIRWFESHCLLGKNNRIYQDLKKLLGLRNRIHIQNRFQTGNNSDQIAFSSNVLKSSEKCTEFVLKYLSANYPRKYDYVKGIQLPWKPYFSEKLIFL